MLVLLQYKTVCFSKSKNVALTCLMYYVLTREETVLKTVLLLSSSSELSEKLS